MLLDNKPYTFDRIVQIGITAALLWGLISLLEYLSGVLIPFAVALLLAYLINPLVLLVQKAATCAVGFDFVISITYLPPASLKTQRFFFQGKSSISALFASLR